mgnify:CR=1 FL=1
MHLSEIWHSKKNDCRLSRTQVYRVGIHTLHRITLMQKLLKPLAIEPRRMSPYIQQIYIIIRFLLLLRVFIQCTILYTHTYGWLLYTSDAADENES